MQRLQQPQDAACVGEAGADRRVQVLDSRQSFQARRIGDFQRLAEGFQGRTDRLHHQLVFVPVLGAVQQGLSEPRIFLGIAAAGDGPGQGMGERLAGANADQAFRGGAEEAGVAAATGEQLGVGMLQAQVFDDLPRLDVAERPGLGAGQHDLAEASLADTAYRVAHLGFPLPALLRRSVALRASGRPLGPAPGCLRRSSAEQW